jgi:carbohydrate kinase (thermoresistant glucokinase family)
VERDKVERVRVIVVMGVSAAGKTTAGRALSHALGWSFYEGDDYHSASNIAKMHRGDPLTDADRAPWLHDLCMLIAGVIERGEHAVLACSALKRAYREALVPRGTPPGVVRFAFLDVPVDVLRKRLADRKGSFFNPSLLDSQIATLEQPSEAVRIDGNQPVDNIVKAIREALEL